MQDTVDPINDERLAMFVTSSHMKAQLSANEKVEEQPENEPPQDNNDVERKDGEVELTQDLFRKYILYARTHCHPQLHDIDQDKVAMLYSALRKESTISGGKLCINKKYFIVN